MVLILTAVLQCVSQYGWHAAIGDIDLKPLLMTLIYSRMAKLSIVSKALLAFMPGSLGVEVLLDKKQLSHIVKQLSITTGIQSTSNEYSLRELMVIFRATTRVHVNCTGLLEEGVEEVLGALMEQDDEIANAIAAEITCRIASGGVNTEEEAMESSSNESNFGELCVLTVISVCNSIGQVFCSLICQQPVDKYLHSRGIFCSCGQVSSQ